MSRTSCPSRRLAASYARSAVADIEAIKAQHALNARVAAAHSFEIPDASMFRVADCGALGLPDGALAFRALIAQIKRGAAPFSRVYVRDLSRLGRRLDAHARAAIERLFEDQGIEIIYSLGSSPSPRQLAYALAPASRAP